MHFTRRLAFACAATFLAACSGGNPAAPGLPSTPNTATVRHREKVHVTLRVRVPREERHRHRLHHRYISPATQSMKVVITNTNPVVNVGQVVNLTPTSTGCTSTLTSVLCTLTISLAPANGYTASVTTYDQTGGAGNALSTAQNIGFNVVAGQTNAINMTLSGIPSQLVVLPGSGASNSRPDGGIDLLGTAAGKLIVEALDADQQIILGPGSPTFAVSQTSGAFSVGITQPSASSPNVFSVTPPSTYSTGTATLHIKASYANQATDGCAQTGAVCDASVNVTMQQLLATLGTGTITVVELGTGVTFATINFSGQGNGLAFDTAGNLYVSICGTHCASSGGDAILKYAPPYSGSPVAISNGVAYPQAIAFDTTGKLYVVNDAALGGGTDNVAVYAPPLNAASVASRTITNSLNHPSALAIDAGGDVFVSNLAANSGNGSVTGYASSYVTGPPSYGPITASISGVGAIALDDSANLYVASTVGSGYVTKYFGYNSVNVGGGAVPYTCTTTCGNAIASNPVTISDCGGCSGFTPSAIVTLPDNGNAPQGYRLFVADLPNNAVYRYSNQQTPVLKQTIASNVSAPAALALDRSNLNLYVANYNSGSVTAYTGGAWPFLSTIANGISSPSALALLP